MKRNKNIKIPTITFDYAISVLGINGKLDTFEQKNQDVKELQKMFALMKGTELDGTLKMTMYVDNEKYFSVVNKIVKGKIEGVDL